MFLVIVGLMTSLVHSRKAESMVIYHCVMRKKRLQFTSIFLVIACENHLVACL